MTTPHINPWGGGSVSVFPYAASDDIAERYDNLSKSVSDRNEKLQITLTRSMSVQDGLDDMMGWMQGLEDSVREKGPVPLDSPALGSLLSKEAVRTPGCTGCLKGGV